MVAEIFCVFLAVLAAILIWLQETREKRDARCTWDPAEMTRRLDALAADDPVFAKQMAQLLELVA